MKQGYYHWEGDVNLEFDTRWIPYFLYCARTTFATGTTIKVGSGPFTYSFQPNILASPDNLVTGGVNRTLSLTVVRNGVRFKYSGGQVTSFEITIDGGILMFNCHIMGTTFADDTTAAGASWVPPRLLGATAHTINMGDNALTTSLLAPGPPVTVTTPMTSTTAASNFNGFTFSVNDNGAVQNRIIPSRAAAFISYGKTDAQITSQLDFLDNTEYDKFVATGKKRIQYIGLGTGATTDRVIVNVYDSVYEDYTVQLPGMGDLIMADATFHLLSSGGAAPPFDITVFTDQAITVPA
ncbi:MAG TPA: phage tail tube protein [Nitrospiraceae bacterium]